MATSNQIIAYECSGCGWITKDARDTCIHCDIVFTAEPDNPKCLCSQCGRLSVCID